MATVTPRVCRLCNTATTTKRSLNLFSSSGIHHQWNSRISSLLEISINRSEGQSPCVCDICKTWVDYLEKALVDLAAFKTLARSSQSQLQKVRGCLKRSKVTSASVGASPDTSKERPPSKLARRRLDFQCKLTLVKLLD